MSGENSVLSTSLPSVSKISSALPGDLPQGDLSLLRLVFAQLRESVVITDAVLEEPGPHIVYVNQAHTRMTGWEAHEVIGKNPRYMQGPKTTRKTLDRLRAQLEKGESFTGEDINYRKDGSEFYIDWYIEPLRDATGTITHFIAVQRDVTERRRLEEQLLRAQRLEGIGLLASGIAHDLNNVFAPILIAPQILRDQYPTPGQEEVLALVENSAQRGINLVKQVLVFARGADGAAGFVQPCHVIDELLKVARSTFPKAISLVSDAPADTWLVGTEATQLYQLLLNLCVNARDAIDEVGTITVRARNLAASAPLQLAQGDLPPGSYVVLTVSDSGSGITAEHRKKLFEPFFTTKDADRGTGLGLATVAMVVKNSGGAIDVESEVGQGTTFSVYLPAAEAATPAQIVPPPLAATSTPRSILIVDDESAISGLMREVLQGAGHRVTTASSGSEAHAALGQARFDLALVDLMMPGEAIGTTAREVQLRGLPLIAISGLGAEEVEAETPDITFLQKPFTLLSLLAAIDSAPLPEER